MNRLKRINLPALAYVKNEGTKNSTLPPIMFLGGFRSDMEGTKALFLEKLCQKQGRAYMRFDYRGHGESEGKFEEACISDWLQDATDVLENFTSEKVMLVGSSMGGWIALLLALQYPQKIHSVIGLAAAPDFTTWMERDMSDDQRSALETQGYFYLENDYDAPYIITKHLLEDGRHNMLLDKNNNLEMPVCLIQGKKDTAVPWETAEVIKDTVTAGKAEIILLEEADHRLSAPGELAVLQKAIDRLTA